MSGGPEPVGGAAGTGGAPRTGQVDASGRGAPAGRVMLAVDTATTVAVVALGTLDGQMVAEDTWTAGYRHGEELLPRIDALLLAAGVTLGDLGAIVVGTGPGAFTGMRVGIATAKALAWGLGLPVVGVSTGEALLAGAEAALGARDAAITGAPRHRAEAPDGAAPPLALLLPAGPSDRILVETDRGRRPGRPRRLTADTEVTVEPDTVWLAVDLAGRATDDALGLGGEAQRRLGETLLRIGAGRLALGAVSDVAGLVPEYVTLPRGVARESAGVTLSSG